ncbi:hypothetical protein [Planococcus halocryophilus]|uniref:hypothetical protein n=1 Tax=Planococcus halocryophilus TaxID=1215089 RepID=UPI001F0ED6EE|nr:hypothetical protein [Planococcus halocryophilus]MCH4828055.1 hypothetical protein [Planococcus halocryophilus]
MFRVYRSFGERLLFFITFSGFSIISAVGVYMFMHLYYPYPVENYLLHSVGIFFLGGVIFNKGFDILLDAEEVTEYGREYLLLFGSLLLILFPVGFIAAKYYPVELVLFVVTSFFMGCVGCFILLSEKTVLKARKRRIFFK